MTVAEIENGFRATVDQFFASYPHIRDTDHELYHIGGVLQAALHILPTERYFALKNYIYETHGYDPGGCKTGQIGMEDMTWTDK